MEQDEKKDKAHIFYREVLELLNAHNLPFLVGGAFALGHYTGLHRDTKDIDLFCKVEDYPSFLKLFEKHGYTIEVTDPRWLAKAFKGEYFVDLIFNAVNNLTPVNDSWFAHEMKGELFQIPIKFIAAEELLWMKLYIQNRERYDGADINHLILRYGNHINWTRLWMRLKQHWQLLLAQFINFQFVYPSDRQLIPEWLLKELLALAAKQSDLPSPIEKVCLGPLIDQTQYKVDVLEWKYKSFTTETL